MYNIEASRKKEAMESKTKQLEKISSIGCPDFEPYIYLPSFNLKKQDLPEMKDWKVGQEYELKIKVRMTGYDEHKSLNSQESTAHGEFDIIGIEPIEEKKLT